MQRKYEFQNGGSQTGKTYIPGVYNNDACCKIPSATLKFPRWMNSMKLFPILRETSRNQKSKMAAHKHKKLICQLVYNVAGQFQILQTCIFGLKNSAKRFPILCNASKRTYISACIQYCCAIPTTIPMISKSRNGEKISFIMCDASWMQNASHHLGFMT